MQGTPVAPRTDWTDLRAFAEEFGQLVQKA
jgi:hypothetical protein